MNGKIDSAIEWYLRLLDDPHVTPRRFLYFELTMCYALQSNWDSCIEFAEKFRTGSLYTPAIATYLEAIFRYAKITSTNDQGDRQKTTELFELVPTLRIRHLGKTITPEKVAVVRAQEYIKNDGLLIVPDLVAVVRAQEYINNDGLLIVPDLVNTSDYVDNYLTAIFYRGVIFRHLADYEKARECQQIIVDL
ncbi:unnamed protein product [Oppiella nova]|uniref:Tetratricopeptide repeat protein n=1 Tax=Oppiella nova TaxID=334625 RepID=A0A7R9M009_9ACAR|nr:unnamed protein product [Oppiella nova]CAG2168526.1 unnamed protein product [Oppiella nova]